jgi:uncharacterized protein YndB with AHSA1/START domain
MSETEIAARTQMLIRRPAHEVFNAFIDPAVTTKFWFTHSSGRVEAGQHLAWNWEMYGVTAQVDVTAVEPDRRIVIEWPYGPKAATTTVEWTFTPMSDDATFVTVTNYGFVGTPAEIAQQAADSTGGFSFVLAGAKALLEHDVILSLVADHASPSEPRG